MVECFSGPVVLRSCRLAPVSMETALSLSVCLAEMDPWRTLGYRPEGLGSYLVRDDPGLARAAVFRGDHLAGVVCVRYPWLRGASLELLAVLSDHRGLGLGAELMAWIEERALSLSSNLWTTVSSFNVKAQEFYERRGFETVARLADLIRPGFDELLLRKRLKSGSDRTSGATSRGRDE